MFRIFNIDIDKHRIFGLDVLRAMAIFFVLYGHSRYLILPFINKRFYEFFLLDGVNIFFVLSGFLIGGILFKIIEVTESNLKSLFGFWKRRWFRTLPNYFLILTIVAIIEIYNTGSLPDRWFLFYPFLQNLAWSQPDFFPESWSLSVEEWFYIIIPFIIYIAISFFDDKNLTILFIIIFLILTITIFRTIKALNYECLDLTCWGKNIRNQVVTRLDSLLYGFLAVYIKNYKRYCWEKMNSKIFIIGVLLLFTPQIYLLFFRDMFFNNYFSFTCTSIGTIFLIPKLTRIKTSNKYLLNFISTVSLVSYSMYLLNYTIIKDEILKNLKPFLLVYASDIIASYFLYIMFWVLTFTLSILLFKYFEMPTTKLRDRKSFQKC